MKKPIILSLTALSLLSFSTFSADQSPKTKQDKISYSIGVDIGKHFKQQAINLNPEAFIQGVKHGQGNQNYLMTDEAMKKTLMSLQTELLEKQESERQQLAQKNLNQGKAFLEKHKKKPGVKVTESGLQYRVIESGKGPSPEATDTVTTHYRGTLIDGTEFDSSYARNQPMEFEVDGVIPGWTEALQMMKPGAKWELVVPPDLAYGEHGVGNVIGPNAVLIFELELLQVQKLAKKD